MTKNTAQAMNIVNRMDPRPSFDVMLGAEVGDEPEIHAVDEQAEEDGRKPGRQIGGPVRNDEARGDDGEDVEEIGRARDAPGNVDEGRDEEEIEHDLEVGLDP